MATKCFVLYVGLEHHHHRHPHGGTRTIEMREFRIYFIVLSQKCCHWRFSPSSVTMQLRGGGLAVDEVHLESKTTATTTKRLGNNRQDNLDTERYALGYFTALAERIK